MTVISSPRRQRQEDLSKFEVSWGYKMSSTSDWASQSVYQEPEEKRIVGGEERGVGEEGKRKGSFWIFHITKWKKNILQILNFDLKDFESFRTIQHYPQQVQERQERQGFLSPSYIQHVGSSSVVAALTGPGASASLPKGLPRSLYLSVQHDLYHTAHRKY